MRTYTSPPPPCRCPFSHAPSSPDPDGSDTEDVQGPDAGTKAQSKVTSDGKMTSTSRHGTRSVSTEKRPQAAILRGRSSTGVGRAKRSDPGGGRARVHLGRRNSPSSAPSTLPSQASPGEKLASIAS